MTRERQIRTVALRDVLQQKDPGFRRRQIYLWYARHCSTPLHLVASLPEDDVFQAYYETVYQEMYDRAEAGDKPAQEDLARERRLLSMTLDELVEARREEDAEEARAADYLKREAEREAADAARAKAAAAPPVPLDQLPPDVVVEFPFDPDDDALSGGLLE